MKQMMMLWLLLVAQTSFAGILLEQTWADAAAEIAAVRPVRCTGDDCYLAPKHSGWLAWEGIQKDQPHVFQIYRKF